MIDADGRNVFVSLDRLWFAQVSHFPCSVEEAEALVDAACGPIVSHEQLLATAGEVALIPIDDLRVARVE